MADLLTAGKMRLRDYQSEAVAATWDWMQNNDGAPIIDAAVGAGKSIIMAEIMRQAHSYQDDVRVLMLTHSSELVRQNHAKLSALMPWADSGIYSAALGKKDLQAQFLFGTIHSVWKKAYDLGRVHLILVDEAHTISRKQKTMWGRFLQDVTICNHDVRMIGLTGTPWRLDSGSLTDGDDRLFHGISYKIGILDLINRGFLVPVVTEPTGLRVDTSDVRKTAGDYNVGQLTGAVDRVTEEAVDDFIRRGGDRRSWMIFAPSIESAGHIRDAVRGRGVSCEIVTADTDSGARERILGALHRGALRSVVSVGTLTTGVDVPPVDMIVALRPTMSSALVIQMIGRGLRLSPGTRKENCLLVDYAGWLSRHGPVDLIEPPARKGSGPAPTKQCEQCDTKLPIHIMTCPTCGFEFPAVEKPEARLVASALPALSTQREPRRVRVVGVKYARHQGKNGKPDTLRVDYDTGIQTYRKWVPIEGELNARTMGRVWWSKAREPGNVNAAPASIAEALERAPSELRAPREIEIVPEGKYWSVKNMFYEAQA
ncbi:DEAD/DEAH box helicase family protein [Acetobacter sacchari]|uniref:DEAD/DEAH box helicase family protein n=1 Tax=Acetobacter sacchari TaxID=2661687 RepID=A0ABS3M130_9PROT|nr:DEAD/DEAH box helicase family protein [Acetobacter sacchari]